jgi:hypothetical protein
MNQAFWTEERVMGSLLVAALLIGLLAVVVMIASGAARGFAAVGGALELMAPYAETFRLLNGMYTVAWVALLLGFALLARLLARAGDEQLAILAFFLILIPPLPVSSMAPSTWARPHGPLRKRHEQEASRKSTIRCAPGPMLPFAWATPGVLSPWP